jgi:hypothetical protein
MMSSDPAARYPVWLQAAYPDQGSRGLALAGIFLFVKGILLIPSLFVLYFLSIAMFVVAYVGYFVVLFTGRIPRGMFDFLAGVLQWNVRANAWLLGLVDRYPPFSLEFTPAPADSSGAMASFPPQPHSPPLPPPPPPPPLPSEGP